MPRAIRASVASLEIGYVAYKLSKSNICWHCQYAPHKSDHSSSMAMLWPAKLAVPLAGFFAQARMQCATKARPPARASIIFRRLALPFIPKPGPPIGTYVLVVTPAAWQQRKLRWTRLFAETRLTPAWEVSLKQRQFSECKLYNPKKPTQPGSLWTTALLPWLTYPRTIAIHQRTVRSTSTCAWLRSDAFHG